MKNLLCFFLLFFLTSFIFEPAYAQIAVVPDILNFTAGQPLAKNVLVQNIGKNIEYVDVTPYVIKKPGTAKEKAERIYNPANSGILVTPSRLIVPAGQQRYVRIILTKPLSGNERIYRVNFVPKIAGLKTADLAHGKEIGLHIIIGYGILVIARPVEPLPEFRYSRKGQQLTLTNEGNTNIMVTGKQCNRGKHCVPIFGLRLYAGLKKHINLPYAAPVIMTTKWLGNTKTYTVR